MANPDNADSNKETNIETNTEETTEVNFETQVNEAFKKVKTSENGKLEFPEGTSEEIKFAVISEKRRRDTQAEYTKVKQNAIVLEKEKEELLRKLNDNVSLNLTDEQKEELNDKKFSDPDKWRELMNRYENEARAKRNDDINKQLKDISDKTEIENRKNILDKYLSENPGLVINDDVINNDIPPRISKELAENKITFEQYIKKVHDYLKTGKVVKTTEETLNQPNLGNTGGGHTPMNKDLVDYDYMTARF